MIADRIRDYALQAEVKASVHTFRHCCATHLLRGGASVRHVQQLLGHSNLSSTEIYTHVELSDLQPAINILRPHRKTRYRSNVTHKSCPFNLEPDSGD